MQPSILWNELTMKATLSRVGLNELLDCPQVAVLSIACLLTNRNPQAVSNARICMLTEVGSGRKLEPTEDAGEAVPEL
jgi:hypothetical protein